MSSEIITVPYTTEEEGVTVGPMLTIGQIVSPLIGTERWPTAKALAIDLGTTPATISRWRNDHVGDHDLAILLRLADVTGESPNRLLRCAGETAMVHVLERLYGKETRTVQTPAPWPGPGDAAAVWKRLFLELRKNPDAMDLTTRVAEAALGYSVEKTDKDQGKMKGKGKKRTA